MVTSVIQHASSVNFILFEGVTNNYTLYHNAGVKDDLKRTQPRNCALELEFLHAPLVCMFCLSLGY